MYGCVCVVDIGWLVFMIFFVGLWVLVGWSVCVIWCEYVDICCEGVFKCVDCWEVCDYNVLVRLCELYYNVVCVDVGLWCCWWVCCLYLGV